MYEKEERSETSVNHHVLDDDECKIRNQGRASAP
jgi:hypothetical protein